MIVCLWAGLAIIMLMLLTTITTQAANAVTDHAEHDDGSADEALAVLFASLLWI
jgi:hypothetical protein